MLVRAHSRSQRILARKARLRFRVRDLLRGARRPTPYNAELASLQEAALVQDVPADEVAAKVTASLCRKSFWEFVKRFWHTVIPDTPQWNWHIKYLCNQMQFLAERVSHNLPKLHDLIINIPPGTTKSTIVSVMFPAWVWTFMPHARFICCSHGERLGLNLSTKCRRVIRSELYQKCFNITMRPDQDTKGFFANTAGGERYTVGSGSGAVMGNHAHFILIDDPIDPESVLSEVELDRVNNWIDEQLSGRKVDKRVTVTVLVMQRLHQCLLPGSKVLTADGDLPIEGIRAGDEIYGSNGWQTVKSVHSKKYRGPAVGVRTYGSPDTTWTTGNHLYLTRRGWVRADELTSADWIKFPNPPAVDVEIPWEPVKYADAPKLTGNATGARGSKIKKSKLRKLLALGLSNIEIAGRLGCHRNTVANSISLYKLKRISDVNPWFGNRHLKDPDFWGIVGLWLAEGSSSRRKDGSGCGTVFTFGYDEQDLADEVCRVLKKYGIPSTSKPTPNGSCIRVEAFCRQLSTWLERHFGSGAHRKRLPEFVFALDGDCRQCLLEAWTEGDGNVCKSGFNVTTVSRHLVRGFQRLVISLGTVPFVSGKVGVEKVLKGLPNPAVGTGAFYFRYGNDADTRPKGMIDGRGCWYKVYKIRSRKYVGPVYDLTTPSRDFVSGNSTVHNSDPTSMMLRQPRVKHVKLPATLDFEVKPADLSKFYKDGLMDPVRLGREVLEEIKRRPRGDYLWAGQYGQDPTPPGGGMFKITRIKYGRPPKRFKCLVRFWDKAGSEKSKWASSYTVGLLMGHDHDGRLWILDVIRFMADSAEREKIIRQTARRDGRHVIVGMEQEPGSGGKESAQNTVRRLIGFRVKVVRPTRDKELRADPFSVQVNMGNVYVPETMRIGSACTGWLADLIEEFRYFPFSTFKDQVDAASGALSVISMARRRVGGMRRTDDLGDGMAGERLKAGA